MGKWRYYILAAAVLGVSMVTAACGSGKTTSEPKEPQASQSQTEPAKQEPPKQEPPKQEPPKDDAAKSAGDKLPGNPENGKTVYSGKCVACHGANGEGGIGPAFVAKDGKPAVAERLSVDDHIKVVTDGRNAMPPFKGQLSDEEIKDVVAFERTMK